MQTADIIRDYIRSELLDGDMQRPIPEDEDLLGTGIVDSLGIVRLVTFMQDRFKVRIPDADVSLENFRSLERIASYHARLTGQPVNGAAVNGAASQAAATNGSAVAAPPAKPVGPYDETIFANIQPAGSKPPLFGVYSLRGKLMFWENFVPHLSPEQP